MNNSWRRSIKNGVLKIFAKFTGKHLLQSQVCQYQSQGLARVFSCEFYEISINNFFTEQLWATKFLRTAIFIKHFRESASGSRKLLLNMQRPLKTFR